MKQPLSRGERWEIVKTLLQRDEVSDDALQAFRCAYPNAPEAMLRTAIFHTYVDGMGAAIDWLVSLEMFLRNPELKFSGEETHLLYHLYNWHQFEALLPEGKAGVLDRLNDIKEIISEGEQEEAVDKIKELVNMFKGNRSYPQFEEEFP